MTYKGPHGSENTCICTRNVGHIFHIGGIGSNPVWLSLIKAGHVRMLFQTGGDTDYDWKELNVSEKSHLFSAMEMELNFSVCFVNESLIFQRNDILHLNIVLVCKNAAPCLQFLLNLFQCLQIGGRSATRQTGF